MKSSNKYKLCDWVYTYSENGKKAQNDLVAQFNYNGADMEVYNRCPLEKEAMAFENKVKNAYLKG